MVQGVFAEKWCQISPFLLFLDKTQLKKTISGTFQISHFRQSLNFGANLIYFPLSNLYPFLKPFQFPCTFSISWSFLNFCTANLVNKIAAFLNLYIYSNGFSDTITIEKDSIYVLAVYSGGREGRG